VGGEYRMHFCNAPDISVIPAQAGMTGKTAATELPGGNEKPAILCLLGQNWCLLS
jgi:hypothetical protein